VTISVMKIINEIMTTWREGVFRWYHRYDKTYHIEENEIYSTAGGAAHMLQPVSWLRDDDGGASEGAMVAAQYPQPCNNAQAWHRIMTSLRNVIISVARREHQKRK